MNEFTLRILVRKSIRRGYLVLADIMLECKNQGTEKFVPIAYAKYMEWIKTKLWLALERTDMALYPYSKQVADSHVVSCSFDVYNCALSIIKRRVKLDPKHIERAFFPSERDKRKAEKQKVKWAKFDQVVGFMAFNTLDKKV